jgi:hypothetical protein
MKNLIIGLALIAGMAGVANAACPGGAAPIPNTSAGLCEYNNVKPTAIYQVSEGRFWYRQSSTGNVWFIVDAGSVGVTNFDRMFATISTALVKSCNIWQASNQDNATNPLFIRQISIYNSCSFH